MHLNGPHELREYQAVHTLHMPTNFLELLIGVLEQNYGDENLKATNLHCYLKMSRSSLHQKMKNHISYTPSSFICHYRLAKAIDLLKHPNLSIKGIAYRVGFRDPNYFSRVFRKQIGMTPTDFRDLIASGQ